MKTSEQTIHELNTLLEESLRINRRVLKHAKDSFVRGIYLGVSLAAIVVFIARAYYS